MTASFTPGPWRWEISRKSKRLHLVGGRPKFDLTLMDFERWGMDGATVRFRDLAFDGMNLMYKLHERPDWIQPFENREHHADWCADVVHPDARLVSASPDLYTALKWALSKISEQPCEWSCEEDSDAHLAALQAVAKVEGK